MAPIAMVVLFWAAVVVSVSLVVLAMALVSRSSSEPVSGLAAVDAAMVDLSLVPQHRRRGWLS